MSIRALSVAAFILSLSGVLPAQTSKPAASGARPEPVLSHARTAFFVIADMPRAGRERQLRELQAGLVDWKRFKLVDRRHDADVTIALEQDRATGLETVVVRQRETGTTLWTATERSMETLMTRMKHEVPPHAPSVCFAVWCR